MAKSADEARAAAMKPKRGLPKGGGKGLKGSNLYTPVSQATIDSIKKAGMAASLKKAATSTDASYVQGVRRMYGADRLAKAKASAKVVAKSPDAARAGSMKPAKPVAKSADAARKANMPNTPATKTKAVNMPNKKSGTTDPFARFVFGVGKTLKGGSNQGMTAAQVAAENKRRADAAKKNK